MEQKSPKPFLSIIIPAYNEAGALPQTLADIRQKLTQAPFEYEIIVVNDGSTDATASLARETGGTFRRFKLLDNAENRGKGAAVRQGMLQSRGEIRLFMDADNSVTIDHLNAMLPHFRNGADIVIASRALPESRFDPPRPWLRTLAGKTGNLLIQALLVPGIRDTQCGFKAFTEKAAQTLFAASRISGWGFDAEILALSRLYGYKIAQIPVSWKGRDTSRVKGSAYLKTLLETVKMKIWISLKKYPPTKSGVVSHNYNE